MPTGQITGLRKSLFATMPSAAVVPSKPEGHLRRSVGVIDLASIGIGATIGTGIFVVISDAIGMSGPGVVMAFLLAGLACALSAFSYAELASSLPASGSSYTYAYVAFGELTAWIIGWDLILEYGLSGVVVAVGWGEYLNQLLQSTIGITIPEVLSKPMSEGGFVNLPALVLVMILTGVLVFSVKQSARINTVMVFVKIGVLLLFVALAATAFTSTHFTPYLTHGPGGVVTAASLIFFAYVGFEAVSTSAEEARRPQRDLPIAILISLGLTTVIYCLVAIAAVGAVSSDRIVHMPAPLATILQQSIGPWGARITAIGALIAIASVVFSVLFGQTRILFAMARDGLLPRKVAEISHRTRTPLIATLLVGLLVAALSAFASLAETAELVNIGTLFAFLIVNMGVLVLRVKQPNMQRGFRAPFIWLLAPAGVLMCLYLMVNLSAATWYRFGIWLVVGLILYASYGWRNSRLRKGEFRVAKTTQAVRDSGH